MTQGDSAQPRIEGLSYVAPGGLRAARVRALLGEVYFAKTSMRALTIRAGAIIVFCLVGSLLLVPSWFALIFAVPGAGLFLLFFVINPVRALLIVSSGGREFSRGSTLDVSYEAGAFVLKVPGRAGDRIGYAQMRNIRTRGRFLICEVVGRANSVMIPLELVPGGTDDWLKLQAGEVPQAPVA